MVRHSMQVALSSNPPADADADAVAVGVWQGGRPDASFARLDGGGVLSRALKASRFSGEEGEVVMVAAPAGLEAGRVAILGLGPEAGLDAARAERLGGALVGALRFSGAESLSVLFDLGPALAPHVAFGMRLKAWHPPLILRSRRDPDEVPSLTAATVAATPLDAAGAAYARLSALAEGVALARDLTVEPGNLLTPETFAKRALLLAGDGLAVEVIDAPALAELGLNLLRAVGRGSAHPPCLVVARWNGGLKGEAPWLFVGKGITFDTGGLSLKRDPKMHEMKGDMGGAAAVLGAVRVLARRKAPVNAVAVLAIAENMVSGRALRPGDVVRSHSGRTVEVVDTDAEGRLVLADALSWACAAFQPRAAIDLATLTGAVVTTLGRHRAGLFATGDDLAARLLAAGEAAGEPLWRLPLDAAHDEDLKSPVADVRNCAWGRVPDALHAARFLQGFVPESVPWAHLDIAGVAEAAEDHPLGPKGPTGFGVRLIDALIG